MDRFAIATALARGCHMAAALSLFGCMVLRGFVVPSEVVVPPHAIEPRDVVTNRPEVVATRVGIISAWLALAFGGVWLAAVSATIAGADNFSAALDALPTVAGHT